MTSKPKKSTPKIQDAPVEGNLTKAEVQSAIKAVKLKKNQDPGRPVSRPMAPEVKNTNWGKVLTQKELSDLLNRLEAKRKARDADALAKKQEKLHSKGKL